MTKQFLTSKEVFVVKGYLSSEKDKVQPIGNAAFIAAQKEAEYIITFAKMAKGKDFFGKQPDSITELKNEVLNALSSKGVDYIEKPKKTEQKVTNQLKKEAYAFMQYLEDTENIRKVNNILQKFNVVHEFEEVGLFFDDEIVKIDKIYTIKEIVDAVKSVINIID